jgi:hypothetical protein
MAVQRGDKGFNSPFSIFRMQLNLKSQHALTCAAYIAAQVKGTPLK